MMMMMMFNRKCDVCMYVITRNILVSTNAVSDKLFIDGMKCVYTCYCLLSTFVSLLFHKLKDVD